MAFQTIKSEIFEIYEQEEIIETKDIAGADGVVDTVTTFIQPYAHIWTELIVKQEIVASKNTSNFRIELYAHAEAGEKGDGFTLGKRSGGNISLGDYYPYSSTIKEEDIKVEPGETISVLIDYVNYGDDYNKLSGGYTGFLPFAAYDIDGNFKGFVNTHTGKDGTWGKNFAFFQDFKIDFYKDHFDIKNLLINGEVVANKYFSNRVEDYTITPLSIDRGIYPTTADNFTDESDPSFLYTVSNGYNYVEWYSSFDGYIIELIKDTVTSMQVALSFDGEAIDIAYRDLAIDGNNYAFDLTEEERELLRQKAQGASTVPIYYIIKTVRNVKRSNYDESREFISKTQRALTIVGCEPVITPTVRDVHGRANYLTGSEHKFIKYVSIAEYSINAVASKYATITSQQVINGSQTIKDIPSGTIEGVDSNTFYFSATDSRNLTARDAIVVDLVPYIKLTSRISKATLNTNGVLTFEVTGNYFNGSFGAVNNSLEFEYSIKENDGDTTWHIIAPEPTFDGNTYTIKHSISGLNYQNRYTISVNTIDEITSIQTEPKVVSAIPVYDWSAEDFRHNTRVKFEEDIEIADSKNIIGNNLKINGYPIGKNKVLWSGASHMNGNQSINLSEAISAQTNGIVLVFSLYRNNAAENVSINTAFVSKKQVELLEGSPHSFFMLVNAGFSMIGAKYLYINDTSISGHEGNTSNGANSGITFNNSNYVLRYVIGV